MHHGRSGLTSVVLLKFKVLEQEEDSGVEVSGRFVQEALHRKMSGKRQKILCSP